MSFYEYTKVILYFEDDEIYTMIRLDNTRAIIQKNVDEVLFYFS
jgi:hypothetical protein